MRVQAMMHDAIASKAFIRSVSASLQGVERQVARVGFYDLGFRIESYILSLPKNHGILRWGQSGISK